MKDLAQLPDDKVTQNDRSYRKCAGEVLDMWTDVRAGALSIRPFQSKPLAFAADAAPMGIQWRFGTWVRVGRRICGWRDRLFVWLIAGVRRDIWEILGGSLGLRSGEVSADTRLA